MRGRPINRTIRGRKTRTTTAGTWRGRCDTPPTDVVIPPLRPDHKSPTTRPAADRGTARGPHQMAASGVVVNRTVGQREKRSIAPRAVAVVGVPPGSCCNHSRRSAAFSHPPAARKSSRLPAVIACSSRAISWRMSGSALVGPAGSAAPWPSPFWGPVFQHGRGAVCCLYARADGDDVHGESPRPERGPEERGPCPTRAARYRWTGRRRHTRTSPPARRPRSAI